MARARPRSRAGAAVRASGLLFALLGCEDPPKLAVVVDAAPSVPPAPSAPAREGCSRVGILDGIESDPSCVLRQASEDAMRLSMKQLTITAALEPQEVVAGGTAVLTVTIKNTSPAEALVVFEAKPRLPGPRPDWSRVVGIPEPHASSEGTPRLFFPISTSDAADHDVDAMPIIAGSAPVPPPATALGVHLRPGGKLTHTGSWWAMRIPAPAPIYYDDAGHRYVPKTAALTLGPGEYIVHVEVPLLGLPREERRLAARVKVVRPPLLDGGAWRPY